MVDYLTAQEIQDYYSQGMTSITVDSMPRLTDEAKDLLEKIDFQIVVESSVNSEQKPECADSHPATFKKRKPFRFSDCTHPRLKTEISNIVKKAKANGKKAGIFAGDFEAAGQWLTEGLDMVVINSELGLMGQTIKSGLNQLNTSLEDNQRRYNLK